MEEELQITETESRYYGDLFLCCDAEKTGKISTLKATELFRSANLGPETIRQVMSLGLAVTAQVSSGSQHHHTGHLSRKQFYACLKLIAAHQASIPLRQDIVTAAVVLPLPRFSWKVDSPTQGLIAGDPDGSSEPSSLQWAPVRSPDLIGLAAARERQQEANANSDQPSTDSEVEQNETLTPRVGLRRLGAQIATINSPEAWSTASDSPTPTNSVAERPWAKGSVWQGLLCEEQRQLLGTEEESSDRHSSDDDNDNDIESIYQITPEQREYYTKQFRAVQPDPNGLLSGLSARLFFEKSRIPVEELRHIWQLCDVTRDGALSLSEFTAAMHLVVLRRNNIPLPVILPPCLMPSVANQKASTSSLISTGSGTTLVVSDPPEADLLHLEDEDSVDGKRTNKVQPTALLLDIAPGSLPSTTVASKQLKKQTSSAGIIVNSGPMSMPLQSTTTVGGSNTSSVAPTTNSPPRVSNRSVSNSPLPSQRSDPVTPPRQTKEIAKEWIQNRDWNTNKGSWTKFPDSPTSNVSSPGPVNFDMQLTAQAVVSDPQILHPVPLRVTPIGTESALVDDESSRQIRKNDSLVYDNGILVTARDQESSPKQMNSIVQQQRDSLPNDFRPIQRPQPKKLPTKGIGALPPPPQRESNPGNSTTDGPASAETVVLPTVPITNNNNSKQEIPPLPPPRPHRHARSSSLDLDKLKLIAPAPPEVPPRVSPQIVAQSSCDAQIEISNVSFADFTQFPDANANESSTDPSGYVTTIHLDASGGMPPLPPPKPIISGGIQSSHRTSAFEVYRKPTPRSSQSPEAQIVSSNGTTPRAAADYEKRVSLISESLRHVTFKTTNERTMADVLHHLKEQNNLLQRLCVDLSDELIGVQQKKEELRGQLETASGVTI